MIRSITPSQTANSVGASPEIVQEQSNISLDDVRTLAAKGDELVFEDLKDYQGEEVGSGLYILAFKVEGGYTLLVGAGSTTGKPLYARLTIPGVEEFIDIRYDDIDGFINKYPVPNEISRQIHQHIDTIMSSPSLSSATGDYIKAHRVHFSSISVSSASCPVL